MSKAYRLLLSAALLSVAVPALAKAPPSPQEAGQSVEEFKKGLHPQTGTITLPGAKARLNLGQSYYFLGPDAARKVLVDAWGNPADAADGVLGMIFPAGKDFADSWGAVVTFEETGHITDEDAASEDYASVLKDMQKATEEANADRVAAGYHKLHLAGWAQAPTYDSSKKVLVWARDLAAEGEPEHSLNYDVRSLGRTGVLSLNMVDGMSNLSLVKAAAGQLGQTVQFDSGARYADFVPGTDSEAGYGLAGLVAAGAGVAAAKKVGLIGLILAFGKKLAVLLAVAAGGAWKWLKGRFGKGDEDGDASAA
ncbi:DUF2167 domain-containing protein [Sphingomonas astaxanthinifaciens]|uniref:Membrane-anchored protein n=1 Tax=Sphingomonas astaxanthinifaciens DSM 22298 TaxID=1123267 RepID=A0ABQ5Z0P7_9SPHN|nr:DUF2167 domain-containing protein [Sphingomonas astaxanthinifaciens]GLR46333.1 hypothetical protein GCM10007925_00440 [Sphingomonas astaxanthinifaciens DSM 22298]